MMDKFKKVSVTAYKVIEENKALRSELQRLQNDLDDALDIKNGNGPTALSRLSNELQKQKELNAELVSFIEEVLNDHRNLVFMMDFEKRAESLIKKSKES